MSCKFRSGAVASFDFDVLHTFDVIFIHLATNQQSGVTVLFLQRLFSRKLSCSCTCFGAAGCRWAGQ